MWPFDWHQTIYGIIFAVAVFMAFLGHPNPDEAYGAEVARARTADFYLQTSGVEAWRVPNGFARFCQTHKSDCGKAGRLTSVYTAKWKDVLIEINARVNRETNYVADAHRNDYWKAADGSGDCEDYAIQKRRELIQAGVPESSMRYAFVEHKGQPHVVLIIRTDDGDRVLDINTNIIYPTNKTGFKWLSVQSRWNPSRWLTVVN